MRFGVCVLVVAMGAVPVMAQTATAKAPKKGDTILIKGCLRGSAVEAAALMTIDAEGTPRTEDDVPLLTYRLQGDKGLLKDLKSKHDRRVVEVKGILRSDLSGSGIGKDVGRTRITIGVDPRTGRSPHGEDRAVPVLEAISFAGTTVSCDR
ncbi:MAG TPA: hypothetical protein VFJ02_14640 [Vicinamibacterales bacterium]|nr:hypothetical protein [Vicinamibacterales bacterium]